LGKHPDRAATCFAKLAFSILVASDVFLSDTKKYTASGSKTIVVFFLLGIMAWQWCRL